MTGASHNMRVRTRTSTGRRTWLAFLIGLPTALGIVAGTAAPAAALPELRLHDRNRVPACVTPERLMQYLERRNQRLAPQFKTIARYYKAHGERYRVRWDYAFYQMLIETNYLTFKRPDGIAGGVPPQDNNFAGVGATVPGKPGERFNDIATGVLAHLQHVLMYSTTRVPEPVANRTRLVQDDVQAVLRRLNRPVTFGDLARIWTGTDKNTYGSNMQRIAEKYASRFCGSQTVANR